MKKRKKFLFLGISCLLITVFVIGIIFFKKPYYEKYHYIAHALGGIDGLDYTNCKEALELSYASGFRLIEVDFLYTSDGHLVCRHNWGNDLKDGFSKENIPDYKTFLNSKIYEKYTPVDLEGIIQFAKEHPDVYFVTDIKPRNPEFGQILELIQETAEKMDYNNVNRQFIIQFYNYEDCQYLKENFDFQNYIFTLYRMDSELKENGITNILSFCIDNDIKVVTLPKKYITAEWCQLFNENNINLYTNTIDEETTWAEYRAIGVNGIYTNFIIPDDK